MGKNTSNKAALRLALEGHARGEIEAMRALLAPSFVSEIHGPGEIFRGGGRREGIVNAIATISEIATEYTIRSHRILELVEEADIIWVRGILDVKLNRSAETLAFPIAGRWQFQDGKALSAEWYFDSARVAAELGLSDGG
jgi:hypothetical protein